MYQRTPKSTAAATLFPSPRRCLSVGAAESRPPPQGNFSQFFWLWTPCNFAGRSLFFHSNDDGEGSPWNRRAVIVEIGRAHVLTPVTNAHLVCRLLLEKKKTTTIKLN